MDSSYADVVGDLITRNADIVLAHIANNSVSSSEIATLIASIQQAPAGLGAFVERRPGKSPTAP